MENIIPVTKTFLPPIKEYENQIQRVWNNQWLTNRGKLVLELESLLKEYLNVSNILVLNNGTIPLQIALKLLGNKGEIITTPFSYVATTAAIVWEGCTPVFVDISSKDLTIDVTKIEESITEKTTCILATHVFGNPCNIDEIESIAKKYNLYVIYDAAHCFGVNYKGKSIFEYGDISTCSFHATKVFHTGEGGAIFCKNDELMQKINYSHNFGHNGPLSFYGLGINAKISELQAAMGLSVFPYIKDILSERKKIISLYDNQLNFNKFSKISIRENTEWNYSYYPIVFESEELLLEAQNRLNNISIFPRRYFYPSLNNLPYVQNIKMPISDEISVKIMCLPLYFGLENNDLEKIILTLNNVSLTK